MPYDKEIAKQHRRLTKNNIIFTTKYIDHTIHDSIDIPSKILNKANYVECVDKLVSNIADKFRGILLGEIVNEDDIICEVEIELDQIEGLEFDTVEYNSEYEKRINEKKDKLKSFLNKPISCEQLSLQIYENIDYGSESNGLMLQLTAQHTETDEELFARLDAEEAIREEKRLKKQQNKEKERLRKLQQFEALKKELKL